MAFHHGNLPFLMKKNTKLGDVWPCARCFFSEMPEFNISMALKVSFPAPITKQKNHVDHCSLVQTEKNGYRCFHEGKGSSRFGNTQKNISSQVINVAGIILFYETCQIFIAHTIHGTIVYFPTWMVHVSGKLGKFTIAWSLWLVERAQALSKNEGEICHPLQVFKFSQKPFVLDRKATRSRAHQSIHHL